MSKSRNTSSDESPAEILGTLRNSGWTNEDLEAVPMLAALLDEETRS